MSLQDYLIEFKALAAEWFERRAFIKDNYDFFTEFFKKENLIKADWPDFQEIGNHIHAFNSMAIAKQNALGRMNHPIEHYRNSFIYLIHGEGTVEERITNFVYDKRYKIKYFGPSVISELLGYIFADQFVLYNERDKFALSFLNIDPGFLHGDNFTQKYSKFNKSITHLIKEYNKIVGGNLDVPINLEVDQFFSYLYEKYHVPHPTEEIKYWQIAPGENAKFWNEFKKLPIAAVGFKEINTDLSGISESEFKSLFQEHYPDKKRIKRTQLWNFINLKPGNKFITNKGKSLLLGAGEVKGGYKYRPEREEFKHTIDVEYYRLSEHGIPIPDKFKGKFGKTITKLKKEDFVELESLLKPVSSKNYWWLNANPKIWDFYKLESDKTEIYTSKNKKGNKRRVYKYFEEVKPGDIILGYVSSPTKEIVGLCEVTKGLHKSAEGEGFEFKKVEQLNDPISLQELQTVSGLENCEPLKNNQGSLFKLTEDEFEIIREIIDEKNPPPPLIEPYSIEKALETVFIEKKHFKNIFDLLNHKKNIIVQGPPGVGKTFIAKHIAWAMMEKKDDSRIQMVQFHQSYSYEDFVQGFRPNEDGNFYLTDGIFYKFCKKAERDKNNKYFFIIDEINRGNISKILGELMMLIEYDKRGIVIPLTYSKSDDTFAVPPNIYLIGTMNTADRSLAMVDYALRRRFCFVDLAPAYETDKFNSFLARSGVDKDLIAKINKNISTINKVIEDDTKNLGPGFKIGHSYFCPAPNGSEFGEPWYERIIDFEIAPLLLEYWFDRREEAERHIERLKE